MSTIKTAHRILALILSGSLGMSLSGCGLFGGGDGGSKTYTYSESVRMTEGAKNLICNDAMALTILGVQKRPISTFAGANVVGDVADSSGANEMSSNSLAIEIDMEITFNDNTFKQITQQSGGDEDPPETVEEILVPESLICIRGTDPNGGDYKTYAVIRPETKASATSAMANSQWYYDILGQTLPEASETLRGSLIFKVSAKAQDLQFVLYTANKNAEPLDADSVLSQNNKELVFYIDDIEE